MPTVPRALTVANHAATDNSWSWRCGRNVAEARTAAERWALFVLCACDAKQDPATIPLWAMAANSSESAIRATCRILKVSARHSRDFARVLRALRHGSGATTELEAHLNVADTRTWRTLLEDAGLSGWSVISLGEYLRVQRFVPQESSGLAALRALLLARLQDLAQECP